MMAVKIFLLTVSIIVAFGLGEGGRPHKCIHDQIAVSDCMDECKSILHACIRFSSV